MKNLFGFSLIILVSTLSTPILADAIRCYVCGNESMEAIGRMKNNKSTNVDGNSTTNSTPSSITAPLSCDEFEKSNPKSDKFIMSCPMGYNGCITEIDGSTGKVVRGCEILALNDCKTANNIAYCYCDTDLCNHIKESTIRRQQFSDVQNHERYTNDGALRQHPTDDEDLNGGSGSHEVYGSGETVSTTTILPSLYREFIETTVKTELEETLSKPPPPNAAATITINTVIIAVVAILVYLPNHY